MVDTLKDYTAKALVNTVDHLGSMSYKVDSLLNENMKHLSLSDLRITCIQQVCLTFCSVVYLPSITLDWSSRMFKTTIILYVGFTPNELREENIDDE